MGSVDREDHLPKIRQIKTQKRRNGASEIIFQGKNCGLKMYVIALFLKLICLTVPLFIILLASSWPNRLWFDPK